MTYHPRRFNISFFVTSSSHTIFPLPLLNKGIWLSYGKNPGAVFTNGHRLRNWSLSMTQSMLKTAQESHARQVCHRQVLRQSWSQRLFLNFLKKILWPSVNTDKEAWIKSNLSFYCFTRFSVPKPQLIFPPLKILREVSPPFRFHSSTHFLQRRDATRERVMERRWATQRIVRGGPSRREAGSD